MGFTLFATLDEFGDFLSTFVLPVALTEAQQAEVRHGHPYRNIIAHHVEPVGRLDRVHPPFARRPGLIGGQ